ncbi:MAG: hypothetical protein K0U93_26190, partial [Gammaproteobacteria bacterium]|nr:hypothetical protein [Gammaproteobacteria bacterium]
MSAGQFGVSPGDLDLSSYEAAGVLDDPFAMPAVKRLRQRPLDVLCSSPPALHATFAMPANASVSQALRLSHQALASEHSPTQARRAFAAPFAGDESPTELPQVMQSLCGLTTAYRAGCDGDLRGASEGNLATPTSAFLARFLALAVRTHSIVKRMHRSRAQYPMTWWYDHGGGHLTAVGNQPAPALNDPLVREFLLGNEHQRALQQMAIQIAQLIEAAPWAAIAANQLPGYLDTPLGLIDIASAANDVHYDQGKPVLLRIELGGNDTYWGSVGVNPRGLPLGLNIDIQGQDRYQYPGTAAAPNAAWLPEDSAGRRRTENLAPVTLSTQSRQGAGRSGIGMLFDLGDGDDSYLSLRASQGYGQFGVGVLFDAGGDDTYAAETLSQGAAQYGIGLLIDAGAGHDTFESQLRSQGFGYVRAIGALLNEAGDDRYLCPRISGASSFLYPSSQMGEDGPISLCQGAGFGQRHTNLLNHLSGGIGL